MKKYIFPFIVFTILLIVVGFPICKYFNQFPIASLSKNRADWGTFGDFFGGTTNAIFGFLGAVFLFITFRQQTNSSRAVAFEAKYYELLKLHRDNVQELGIKGEGGKKVFILLIREFREILKIINEIPLTRNEHLSSKNKLALSYMALYYGTGPNSTRILEKSTNGFKCSTVSDLISRLDNNKKSVKEKRKFKFTPFEGHQSRLGHYYRHLFQTIKFIDEQEFLTRKQKYEYVKTIRAQLSNHEQALLFLNSLSKLGQEWDVSGMLAKYQLIKNLPEDFFDPNKEINVKEIYPEIKFEWEMMFEKPKQTSFRIFNRTITVTSLPRRG